MRPAILERFMGNIRSARFTRSELSGALGDMGLYIPIVTALVAVVGMDLGNILFFSGFFNIISGIQFGIPVCVQPMKAIAAIAISEGLSVNQILAAGVLMGGLTLVLGITGLITAITRLVPKSIVRGIQIGVGLKLVMEGMSMIEKTGVWMGLDSYLTGTVCGLFILTFFLYKRVPTALIMFLIGLVVAVVKAPSLLQQLHLQIYIPHIVPLSSDDFITGGLKAGLPQLPLTLLNSVIALCALSRELFPDKPVKEREISISVGIMNIVGCWMGGMPSCHGSGGLSGQYAYGARTGGSMIMLGLAKMLIAVFFGMTILPIFVAFPKSILGALLFFSGMELVMLVKDMQRKKDLLIVFVMVASILVLNTLAGLVIGGVCYLISSKVWPMLEAEGIPLI